jgi:hypothetical protein
VGTHDCKATAATEFHKAALFAALLEAISKKTQRNEYELFELNKLTK